MNQTWHLTCNNTEKKTATQNAGLYKRYISRWTQYENSNENMFWILEQQHTAVQRPTNDVKDTGYYHNYLTFFSCQSSRIRRIMSKNKLKTSKQIGT